MLKTSSVLLISNGTAKTKLAILQFLYCGEFVKTSHRQVMEIYKEHGISKSEDIFVKI